MESKMLDGKKKQDANEVFKMYEKKIIRIHKVEEFCSLTMMMMIN